jgi:hypothetical protein
MRGSLTRLILAFLLGAAPAQAEKTTVPPSDALETAQADGYLGRPDDLKPGSLMGGSLAVFPGIVFHGTGHLYTGDIGTGIGLLAAEVIGIGLMAGGFFLEKNTSGSPEYSGLQQVLSHAGFMLFAGSWAADMVGAFKGTEPFDIGQKLGSKKSLGITYRYTGSPLNGFRHHAVLDFEFNRGRFFVRPSLDLEANLSRREVSTTLGVLLFGEDRTQDHLLFGTTLGRLENRTDGWARQSAMGYLQSQIDLGRFIPTLRRFYIMNRVGYGLSQFQFNDIRGNVPAIFSDSVMDDSWLYLETGAFVNLTSKTNVLVSVTQDPNGVIAPSQVINVFGASPELESLRTKLSHAYGDDIQINLQVVAGEGLGIWMGLEYER